MEMVTRPGSREPARTGPEVAAAALPAAEAPAPPLAAEQVLNVEALLEHVAESGLDRDGTVVAGALEALLLYREAAAAAGEAPARLGAAKDLLRAHGQLAALAAPTGVSGRSIRSSAASPRHLARIRVAGILFVIAAVSAELVTGARPGTIEGHVAGYAVPFSWGAIGAVVFLMKAITDRASELAFDARKLQGLPERILLGALCGMIVVNVLGAEAETLTRAAIGFLAGLGTKAVYAAFETLVNGIADRVGGRGAAPPPSAA